MQAGAPARGRARTFTAACSDTSAAWRSGAASGSGANAPSIADGSVSNECTNARSMSSVPPAARATTLPNNGSGGQKKKKKRKKGGTKSRHGLCPSCSACTEVQKPVAVDGRTQAADAAQPAYQRAMQSVRQPGHQVHAWRAIFFSTRRLQSPSLQSFYSPDIMSTQSQCLWPRAARTEQPARLEARIARERAVEAVSQDGDQVVVQQAQLRRQRAGRLARRGGGHEVQRPALQEHDRVAARPAGG